LSYFLKMANSSRKASREGSVESGSSSDTNQPLGQTGQLREFGELFPRLNPYKFLQRTDYSPISQESVLSTEAGNEGLKKSKYLHNAKSPSTPIYQYTLEDTRSAQSSRGQENHPPDNLLAPALCDGVSIPYTLKLTLPNQVFAYEGKTSPNRYDGPEQETAAFSSAGHAKLDGIELCWNVSFIKERPEQSTRPVLGCISRSRDCCKPAGSSGLR
jgi:hypothetical protein